MTIIMSDACTIYVLMTVIDDSSVINYKNIMVVNDTSRVIRMTTQLGASLTDDSRSIIHNHNMFIIQATGLEK